MGVLSRAADTYYTYRFLKILTTDWEDMEAYKLGIIDEKGEPLKKSRELRSNDEKSAYTLFHRLVFSIRRLLEKFPGGRTVVGRYAAALFLIKETTGMSDEQIGRVLDKAGFDVSEMQLDESVSNAPWFMQESKQIAPGTYVLKNQITSPTTGELIGHPHQKIIVDENTVPIGSVMDCDIYSVRHVDTHQNIYISARDITR